MEEVQPGVQVSGKNASPGILKKGRTVSSLKHSQDPKDDKEIIKKYKKRIANEKKNKQEAIVVLQEALECLRENTEALGEKVNLAIQKIENSITILSRSRKEISQSVRSLRREASSPFITQKSSLKITKEPTEENVLESTNCSNEKLVETNKRDPKRMSLMRRGTLQQNCTIDTISNMEIAFTKEVIDGEEETILAGGNIISIFKYLIHHDRSTENISSFLCMYRNFTTSKIVMKELNTTVKEWTAASSSSKDLHSDRIYQQICRIVQQWIEHYVRLDFWKDASLIEQLLETISYLPSIASMRLQKLLEFKLSECSEQEFRKPMRQEATTRMEPQFFEILSIDPAEIAEQLTLLEFEMLQDVDPVQCITSASRKNSSPIQRLIERFNIVSRWVATEIVMETVLKKRVSKVKFFIEIAENSYNLGNFNSVLEITAGLTLSPISRLSRTWDALPKKSRELFDQHLKLMDGSHNFANYRNVLQNTNLPCLPYFGIFLRDLTFVDDSLDNTLENGFVNFHKMKRMTSIVQSIIHYQATPFSMTVKGHLYNYLKNVAPLREDTLYDKSTKCEPPSELWNL